MRKLKLFITFLTIYEFIFVSILRIQDYCVFLFNNNFCGIVDYKYFLICFMVPWLFLLLLWWWRDISNLFHKQKEQDSLSNQDKIIMNIIILLLQKYIQKHPKLRDIIKTFADLIRQY